MAEPLTDSVGRQRRKPSFEQTDPEVTSMEHINVAGFKDGQIERRGQGSKKPLPLNSIELLRRYVVDVRSHRLVSGPLFHYLPGFPFPPKPVS